MQLTPQTLDFLFTQFSSDYQRGYGAYTSKWQEFAERIPSSTELNTYGWMADLPGFREWVGARVMRNISLRAYTLRNKDWEDSFAVSRNAIEDDQFGLYSRSAELLGNAASRLWDDVISQVLQAGVSSICCDGQFFFDTDHPVDLDDANSAIYSNKISAKPLTTSNIASLKTTMASFKGESGRSLEIRPNLLIVPTALEFAAYQAVGANMYAQPVTTVDGSQNVAAVPLPNPYNSQIKVLVVPQLDNEPTIYYLADTTRLKPLILQVRKEPQIVQRTAPDMDNVFHRKEFEYGADARGNGGYGLPFTMLRVSTV